MEGKDGQETLTESTTLVCIKHLIDTLHIWHLERCLIPAHLCIAIVITFVKKYKVCIRSRVDKESGYLI